MKFQSLAISALIAVVAATPVPESFNTLQARQSATSDELKNGACKDVTFIFARGSTETGNMVRVTTPIIDYLNLIRIRVPLLAPRSAPVSKSLLEVTRWPAKVLGHHMRPPWQTTSCPKILAHRILVQLQLCSTWPILSARIPKLLLAVTGMDS